MVHLGKVLPAGTDRAPRVKETEEAPPTAGAGRAYSPLGVASFGRWMQVNRISAYDAVVYRYGFKPAAPEPTDVLTSMFLHGGWLHLIGNMLFLWIYGDNVEHRLGPLGYLIAYLGTGVAAAFGDAQSGR